MNYGFVPNSYFQIHNSNVVDDIVRSLRRRRVREAAQIKNTRCMYALLVPCAHDFGLGLALPAREIHMKFRPARMV